MTPRTQRRLLRIGRTALSIVSDVLARGGRADRRSAPSGRGPATGEAHRPPPRGIVPTTVGRPQITYAPARDGDADPGEIVWTWVPYEDDPSQGKDRPVVVIGRLDDDVAALQLTSRPHDDRHHHPLGSGGWDHDGRPSWVKLDRMLRLQADGIRREGAVLDRSRFDGVVAAFQSYDPS